MLTEALGVIADHEVAEAVASAGLVEEYPGDRPYPSCLLFGLTGTGRPVHVVAAYDEAEARVLLVTVYEPDPRRWEDYRRRRR